MPSRTAAARDVASDHPDIVADLVKEAAAQRAQLTMGKPLFDELSPAYKD